MPDAPATPSEMIAAPILGFYTLVSIALLVFAFHRFWLSWLARSLKTFAEPPTGKTASAPTVAVQLPIFNEPEVAERVILAAGEIRYPPDRFEVQVLDDSTDPHSRDAVDRGANTLKDRGVTVSVIRRDDRIGFKAGALQHGLLHTDAELLAIFDADFVPPKDFLERTVPSFRDPRVGVVQARWTHLNHNDCWLTRAQAYFLDAHFLVQHVARLVGKAWINFNGTAGVWRRETIADAGGWKHDTLTEDLDLSYRANLRGWTIAYLPHVGCPAELPPTVAAFKSQQHRWTKGTMQVCLRQTKTVLSADLPFRVKVEALFHLGSPIVHILLLALMILMAPAMWASETLAISILPVSSGVAALTTASIGVGVAFTSMIVYLAIGQRHATRTSTSIARAIVGTPLALAVAAGLALTNTRAFLEACLGRNTPFIRTPKFGVNTTTRSMQRTVVAVIRHLPPLETALAAYLLASLAWAIAQPAWFVSTPMIAIFATGVLWMATRQALENATSTAQT